MALNDLTGQNIQDTYQKVVQTDGVKLADGTGSLLPISFEGNDVIIPGALKAQSYIVSESILNVSSGSTVFGDTITDVHQITGSLFVSNNLDVDGIANLDNVDIDGSVDVSDGLSVHGSLRANRIYGTVETEQTSPNISYVAPNFVITDGGFNLVSTNGHITASGNISSSGTILAERHRFKTVNDFIGFLSSPNKRIALKSADQSFDIIGDITASNNISASGEIIATGDITANNINGTINGGTF